MSLLLGVMDVRASTVLICSFGASVDGFVSNRDGDFGWGAPSDDLFAVHLDRVRSLSATLLGRRLYEAMTVWETDPRLRDTPAHAEFADVWSALPKVVFSRTLPSVKGNARLATRPLAEEIAAATVDGGLVEIGGPTLFGQALQLGLLDEVRIFRYPVIVGGGTPLLPPVPRDIALELLETREFDARVVYERYRVLRPGK